MTDEFNIDFGKAKVLPLPPEGNYTLRVVSYELKQAKNPESRSKGFNVSLQFDLPEDPEWGGIKIFHNLWVQRDNPFAAKAFFEALTGKDLEDDKLDISDPDMFIGETVGATLIHEEYIPSTGGAPRTKLAVPRFDSFYKLEF